MSSEVATQHVAFSAIRNPVNPDRVIIYRIAPEVHTLSYEQRTVRKGTVSAPRWNKTPDPDTGIPSPVLLPESHLATLVYDDVVHIYGVNAKGSRLSLLSPFVELMEPKVECYDGEGKIAGCVFTEHDEEQAWLVYEAAIGDGNKAPSKLKYCDVTTPQTPDSDSSAKDIMKKTCLSLFHDTRRCWVVFQNQAGQLVVHNEREQKPSVISADTALFDRNTPIASCFIPAKDIDTAQVPGFPSNALGRVIVYWVRAFNGKPRLYRSHADLTEKSASADFSEPQQATENGVAVEPLAQISVIPNPKTQSNYLFVAKHGGDNISSVIDDWATQNESHHEHGRNNVANSELFERWQAKVLEEALVGRRLESGSDGHSDGRLPSHHHLHNGHSHGHGHPQPHPHGHSNGYANGHSHRRLTTEEEMRAARIAFDEIMEDEVMGRSVSGTRDLPLVCTKKGGATKPQLHSGVISRTARSKWSEAEVHVMIPAGSTIMGDITVQLKVRPTD